MRGRIAATLSRRPKVDDRVVYQAASWLLSYPDDDLLARLPVVRSALAEQPDRPETRALLRVTDHLSAGDGEALRQAYVEVFDLSRKQTLYLTYWSDGDTRRRGSALGAFKKLYRESDFLVDTRGELTDYLPMVLEFAARADPAGGRDLLIEHRPSLELIRLALAERDSVYTDVLVALCATLPGESPADKAAALALRGSSPTVERVGLEPGDPRLLPLFTTTELAARGPRGR